MRKLTDREKKIQKLNSKTVNRLVDSISNLMEKHSEPYRTLAEALILSQGSKAVHSMCTQIDLAVEEDCGVPPKRLPRMLTAEIKVQ